MIYKKLKKYVETIIFNQYFSLFYFSDYSRGWTPFVDEDSFNKSVNYKFISDYYSDKITFRDLNNFKKEEDFITRIWYGLNDSEFTYGVNEKLLYSLYKVDSFGFFHKNDIENMFVNMYDIFKTTEHIHFEISVENIIYGENKIKTIIENAINVKMQEKQYSIKELIKLSINIKMQ